MNTAETNADVVKNFFAACAANEPEAAAAFFADDGKWIIPGNWVIPESEPGITYQRSEIAELVRRLNKDRDRALESGLTFTFSQPANVEGDRVLVEASVVDRDGRVLERAVDVFRIRDGKILVKDVFRKG